MAVSNYIRDCDYHINEWADEVVLVFQNTTGLVIDDGYAYVETSASRFSYYNVKDLSVEETIETDGKRNTFHHRISFTVINTYYNDSGVLLSNSYIPALRTKNGDLYVPSPVTSPNVTNTFVLSNDEYRIEVVVETYSDYPLLPLETQDNVKFFNDAGCTYDTEFKNWINKIYIFNSDDVAYDVLDWAHDIHYIEEGAYDISDVLNPRATVTFGRDGNNVNELTFYVPLDIYKRSWYYNLVENPDNRYSVLIEDNMNNTLLLGFYRNGMSPSYTLEGALMKITLRCEFDDVQYFTLRKRLDIPEPYYPSMYYVSGKFQFTPLENVYNTFNGVKTDYDVCMDDGTVKYVLLEKTNYGGQGVNKYLVRNGFQQYFQDKEQIGTFSDVDYNQLYIDEGCAWKGCNVSGTLADPVRIPRGVSCVTRTFKSNCDWNIPDELINGNITVTPTSGEGGTEYTLTICLVAPQYRMVVSGYTCVGTDKYQLLVQQESTDGGTTWTNTGVEARGELIEHESEDCGYVPSECTISGISCSPTAATLTTAITAVSTTVTVQGTEECNLTWITTIKDPSSPSPSGDLIVSGGSGDSLQVKSAQTVTIRSTEDNTKTCTFVVSQEQPPAPTPTFEAYFEVFINSSLGGHSIHYDSSSGYFQYHGTQRVMIDTTFQGTLNLTVTGTTVEGYQGMTQFVIEDYQTGNQEISSVTSSYFVQDGTRWIWDIDASAVGAQGSATINLVKGGTLSLICYLG